MEEDGSGLLVEWFSGAASSRQIILKSYRQEMVQLVLRHAFRFVKRVVRR